MAKNNKGLVEAGGRRNYTAVVYIKKRVKRVVFYIPGDVRPFVITVPSSREIGGKVVKRWVVGGVEAYTVRMRAIDVVQLIDAYAHEEAVKKIHMLDPIYREAVKQGYKVHSNGLYVQLWLTAPLGTPLFHVGDPRERELGSCIKHFTHSYRIWRMVTPPWAASC